MEPQMAVCHYCFQKGQTKTERKKSDKLLAFTIAALFFPLCILVVFCILCNKDYDDVYHACPLCNKILFKRTGVHCGCDPPIEKIFKAE